MLTLIDRWFEPVTPSQDYQRSDYVVLWLILAAGAVLRFWGLGNVGLHGDEETMALPAMAILETGLPMLPSGMFYPRALINVYLMSGSAWLFGESEWAFRLPSAIVGSLTGLAAFFMGRRFLSPHWNLAFVATIALLPSMIEVSQTARMYVYFVTCTIWFAACLFRWERDQRIVSLFLTMLVWLLALHFQTLAVFAAPLFLYPGLSRRSWTQVIQGGTAFIFAVLVFNYYQDWAWSYYPESSERPPLPEVESTQSALQLLASGSSWLLIASVLVIAVLAVALLSRASNRADWSRAVPIVLAGLGLLAMAMLHYHIGGILLAFGILLWLREPGLSRPLVVIPMLLAGIMAAVHLGIIQESGLYPGRKAIGALVGMPSVWPIFRFLEYSPFAGMLFGIGLVYALVRFVTGQRLPIHFLFFAMAVWAPLLLLGFFAWDMPPRYAQGHVGYFLFCTFAAIAYVAREKQWMPDSRKTSRGALVALLIISAVIVNPVTLSQTVNPGYDRHPDHKGAAEFIESLELSGDAILIAEDIIQQAYYLGDVDYSLRPIDNAVQFSIVRDGKILDQYTAVPVLGDGKELEGVLDAGAGKDIYIIGSGENFVNGERRFRGRGISDVLMSERVEIVYDGRDGKTKVWKARP